jgi:phosphatidylglycerophosphate synthase
MSSYVSDSHARRLPQHVARELGNQSAFGGYLDITLDMAAYSAMAMGFAVAHPEPGLMWNVILAGYVLWTLFPAALVPVGWVWVALLLATAIQRTWLAWQHLPSAGAPGP